LFNSSTPTQLPGRRALQPQLRSVPVPERFLVSTSTRHSSGQYSSKGEEDTDTERPTTPHSATSVNENCFYYGIEEKREIVRNEKREIGMLQVDRDVFILTVIADRCSVFTHDHYSLQRWVIELNLNRV